MLNEGLGLGVVDGGLKCELGREEDGIVGILGCILDGV